MCLPPLQASPPFIYYAIKMNIQLFRWQRALDLALQYQDHVTVALPCTPPTHTHTHALILNELLNPSLIFHTTIDIMVVVHFPCLTGAAALQSSSPHTPPPHNPNIIFFNDSSKVLILYVWWMDDYGSWTQC